MNKIYIASVLIIFMLLTGIACQERKGDEKEVVLTGQFTTVGNVPFQKLVFRALDGTLYEVVLKEAGKYKESQGRQMHIKAVAGSFDMETADKKYKRKILYLKNIRVNK